MKPDGNFVIGTVAAMIVVLTLIGCITHATIEGDKREIEFAKLCQSQGKEAQYRETATAIYSECK